MEEDSPRARVCAAISGIGLSPLEGVDVLASTLFELLAQVRPKEEGSDERLLRLSFLAAETLLRIRAGTAEAYDGLMILTLGILQITGEGQAMGKSVPEWRKRAN